MELLCKTCDHAKAEHDGYNGECLVIVGISMDYEEVFCNCIRFEPSGYRE